MGQLSKKSADDQMEFLRHRTLIYSYLDVLTGENRKMPRLLFGGDDNPFKRLNITLFLLKFLLIYVLEYDEEEALQKFNFEKYKLNTILDHGFIFLPLVGDKKREQEQFFLRDPELAIRLVYAWGNIDRMKVLYQYIANLPTIKPYRKEQLNNAIKGMMRVSVMK